MMTFWVFDFYETFICYMRYFKLNCNIRFFKLKAGRTVFRKSTPNLTITSGDFESNFEVLKKKKLKKPLKVPSCE